MHKKKKAKIRRTDIKILDMNLSNGDLKIYSDLALEVSTVPINYIDPESSVTLSEKLK